MLGQLQLRVDDAHTVSALWLRPDGARAAYVFAHGAGAGMAHVFMADMAGLLAQRGIATLRFNFPFVEAGSKRPDRPALAHASVRAAVATVHDLAPDLPLFAGGKSFGGRMTSQAQAEAPLPGVRGLAFLGFPLHAAKMPSTERAAHLAAIAIPLLFVQGTRDALAQWDLLEKVVSGLDDGTALHVVEGGDHSFAVPARLKRSRDATSADIATAMAAWMTH